VNKLLKYPNSLIVDKAVSNVDNRDKSYKQFSQRMYTISPQHFRKSKKYGKKSNNVHEIQFALEAFKLSP